MTVSSRRLLISFQTGRFKVQGSGNATLEFDKKPGEKQAIIKGFVSYSTSYHSIRSVEVK